MFVCVHVVMYYATPTASLYCCLELDEYGKFERKARTLPSNNDPVTLITTWDQVCSFVYIYQWGCCVGRL